MPIVSGDHKNAEFTKVLIARITNWKNYKRIDWKFKTMWESTSGIDFCGINRKILRKVPIGDYVLWFPKGKKQIWANSRKDGLVHSGYNFAYLIILFFLFLLTILNQT
jgi:hypothetical protein